MEGFAESLSGEDLSGITAFCIGRQTAKAAEKHGMKTVVSEEASVQSLVQCVLNHLK